MLWLLLWPSIPQPSYCTTSALLTLYIPTTALSSNWIILFCLYILLTMQLNTWFWSWTWFTRSLQLELFGFWTLLSSFPIRTHFGYWICFHPHLKSSQSPIHTNSVGLNRKNYSNNWEISKCLHTFSLEDGIRFSLQNVLFLYMMTKSRNQQSEVQLCHCQKCLWLTQSSQHFNTFFHLPRFYCRHFFLSVSFHQHSMIIHSSITDVG